MPIRLGAKSVIIQNMLLAELYKVSYFSVIKFYFSQEITEKQRDEHIAATRYTC